MSEQRAAGERIEPMEDDLRAAGIGPFAGLPWYDRETGKRDDRVNLDRLPLRWVVSQAFWDRYFAPLELEPTMALEYGGWPIEVADGPPGEWAWLVPNL